MPVFFLQGLIGRVLPAAGDLLRPRGARVPGRRADGHAGAGPDPARARRRSSDASSPLARWLQRGYEALLTRIVARPRPAYAAVGAIVRRRPAVVAAQLGQSLLPDFKERDFLMHWVTAPGTSHAGGDPHLDRGLQRAARRSPASATAARTSGRRCMADEPYGIHFGENWISVDPDVDYDKTLAADPGGRRRLSRPPARRPDLPQGADPRGADGIERRDRRAHLRRRPRRPARRRRRRSRQAMAEIDGLDRAARRAAGRHPAGRGRGRPRGRASVTASSRATCGARPSACIAGEEVGDIFRDGKAYDVTVWSTPDDRATA